MRRARRAWAGCMLALVLGNAAGGAAAIGQGAQTVTAGSRAISPDNISPDNIAPNKISPNNEAALHAMSRIAAVIFAGQVIAIRRHPGIDGATGIVEIEFSVSDAIRGVGVGVGPYILREWAGLWSAGYEPLAVGQRYLMLLHAPGAAGLSSPVGGNDGAVSIGGGDGVRRVDLRWIAARATRIVSYRAEPAGHAAPLPFAVRADAPNSRRLQVDVSGPSPGGSFVAEGAAYATVLGVLRSWEKSDDAAR